jgi:hypothetical protein
VLLLRFVLFDIVLRISLNLKKAQQATQQSYDNLERNRKASAQNYCVDGIEMHIN